MQLLHEVTSIPGIYMDNIHYFSVSAVIDSFVCFIEINVFKQIIRENIDFASANADDCFISGMK
ncbi:MAG: hypothetical protein HQ542_06880 [Bacteroidia bacterium]|nr:hypothetical protein [Bacteroidia bacterium]